MNPFTKFALKTVAFGSKRIQVNVLPEDEHMVSDIKENRYLYVEFVSYPKEKRALAIVEVKLIEPWNK